jgi:hypothetical protein
MIENIPTEITLASFSFITLLSGYIWNDQKKEIQAIKEIQEKRPCHIVAKTLVEIQTDISWIKKNIK